MKNLVLSTILAAMIGLTPACTTVKSNTVCPVGTIGTSWSTHDSNIGGTLIAAGLSAASAAGYMARLNGSSSPPQTTISVNSTYPWGFGTNGGATGCVIPTSTPPTTTINNNGTLNMSAPAVR